MLENTLIEKALSLTNKTMEDMNWIEYWFWADIIEFSIEKFCYYLLSPEFIEKYKAPFYDFDQTRMALERVSFAIYEYQSSNEEPLIALLSKI